MNDNLIMNRKNVSCLNIFTEYFKMKKLLHNKTIVLSSVVLNNSEFY